MSHNFTSESLKCQQQKGSPGPELEIHIQSYGVYIYLYIIFKERPNLMVGIGMASGCNFGVCLGKYTLIF